MLLNMIGDSIRLYNIDEETNKPLSSDELVGTIKDNSLHISIISVDEDLCVIIGMVSTLVDIVTQKYPLVIYGVLDFKYPGTHRVRDSSGKIIVDDKGRSKIELNPYCKNITTIVQEGNDMVAESIIAKQVSTFGDPKRPGKQMMIPIEYLAKWFEINIDLLIKNKIKYLSLEEVGKPDDDGWIVAGARHKKSIMKRSLSNKMEDQIVQASKGKLMC